MNTCVVVPFLSLVIGGSAILSDSVEQSTVAYSRESIYNSSETIQDRSTAKKRHGYYGQYPVHTYQPEQVDYFGNAGDVSGVHYPEEIYPVQPVHTDTTHHNPAALAVKALLFPLFGVALIGVVTALVSNPVLLQLGVLSGKKRKRRHTPGTVEKLHHLSLIAGIISQMPKSDVLNEEKKIVANYLQCSGLAKFLTDSCLQRLNCEAWSTASGILPSQRHLIRMVLSDITGNEYIEKEIRDKLEAAKGENDHKNCSRFVCDKFSNTIPEE